MPAPTSPGRAAPPGPHRAGAAGPLTASPVGGAARHRIDLRPLLLMALSLAVIAAGSVLPMPTALAASTVDGKDLLSRRHVDAAHVSWADGHLDVQVVDGQTVRPADDVAVRLGPDADADGAEVSRITVPNDPNFSFLGKPGDHVWNAPQHMYANWAPVWAGLGAGDIPDTIDPSSISLELKGTTGPGTMEVYRTNYAGTPKRAFSSADGAPASLRSNKMKPGAHGHYNWAFTKPGRYDVQWQAHARTTDGKPVSSPVRTVTWYVGTDEQAGLPAGSYQGTPITRPIEEQTGTPNPSDPAKEQPNPTKKPGATDPADNVCTHIDSGHLDVRGAGSADNLRAFLRWDGPKGKPVDLGSASFVIEVPDSAKSDIPATGATADLSAALNSTSAYQLPEIQDENLPWMGFSTEDLDVPEGSKVSIGLLGVEAPSPNARFALGHFDSGSGKFAVDLDSTNYEDQQIDMPGRTHTHRAQFFSEPGYYTVYYWVEIVKPDGTRNYATLDAWYAVGTDAIANACERTGETSPKPEDPAPTDPAPEDPEIPFPGDDTGSDGSDGEDTSTPGDGNDTGSDGSDGEDPDVLFPGDGSAPAPKPGTKPGTKPAPKPDTAQKRIILERGHVDIWHVTAKNGALNLGLSEDVTGSHVTRDPASVELHVKDAAKTTIPQGWPGAGTAWYLPQAQKQDVLWPGWDTQGIKGGGVADRVDLAVTKVTGPGKIHLFGSDAFGKQTPLLTGGATELKAGAVRKQTFPAHTHANWVFTKPGVYTVTVQARGTAKGRAIASKEQTYTFTVGDDFRGKASGGAAGDDAPASGTPGSGADGSADQPGSTGGDTGAPGGDAGTGDAGGAQNGALPAGGGSPASVTGAPAPADDSGSGAPMGAAAPSGVGGMKQPAMTECDPADFSGAGASDAGGASDADGASGASDAGGAALTPSGPAPGGTSFSGALTSSFAARFTAGSVAQIVTAAVSGSYTIPAKTHVHPNWVFSKPGSYTLVIRQTVTGKDGKTATSRSHLKFEVGPNAKGVTDGHFDFGAQYANGTLVGAVKDDRSSPAKWVKPSSMTFALNDTAKTKAPAGIEFVAPAGSDVWMIPASQIAGVPWLGANSMHPSIVDGTTGTVQLTLESVSGPGSVGVFTSGNFGSVVGEKWFSGSGSGGPAAAGSEKSAAGGTGQDAADAAAQGAAGALPGAAGPGAGANPCIPTGSMPRTGATVAPIVATAMLAVLGGAALVAHRRRSATAVTGRSAQASAPSRDGETDAP